jgi:hypothetical protein
MKSRHTLPFKVERGETKQALHVQQFCIVVLHRLGLERPLGEHLVTVHMVGEGGRGGEGWGWLWNEAY